MSEAVLCADHCAVVAPTKEHFQTLVYRLSQFSITFGLATSVIKTQVLLHTHTQNFPSHNTSPSVATHWNIYTRGTYYNLPWHNLARHGLSTLMSRMEAAPQVTDALATQYTGPTPFPMQIPCWELYSRLRTQGEQCKRFQASLTRTLQMCDTDTTTWERPAPNGIA